MKFKIKQHKPLATCLVIEAQSLIDKEVLHRLRLQLFKTNNKERRANRTFTNWSCDETLFAEHDLVDRIFISLGKV